MLPPDQIRISGGGARSPLWRQILADVLQVELVTADAVEAAAGGAALPAGIGTGLWRDIHEACGAACSFGQNTTPDTSAATRYKDLHGRFKALYPALKE